MSKIAALQLPTLALSESRLDYYIKASKDNGADLVILGEYVINSFFTELISMPKNMIKEQSEVKKESLVKFAKKYGIEIIAPFVTVEKDGFKKLCLKISKDEIKKYEQQILMSYSHWNEEKFFKNSCKNLKLFNFKYKDIKCALCFGFEAHFDFFWTEIRAKKIDLLILPTASTFNSEQRWLEMLKTRAFLNSCAVLRVNRIGKLKNDNNWNFYGNTLYINAFGELIECLKDKEEMLIIDAKKAKDARKLWKFELIAKKYNS